MEGSNLQQFQHSQGVALAEQETPVSVVGAIGSQHSSPQATPPDSGKVFPSQEAIELVKATLSSRLSTPALRDDSSEPETEVKSKPTSTADSYQSPPNSSSLETTPSSLSNSRLQPGRAIDSPTLSHLDNGDPAQCNIGVGHVLAGEQADDTPRERPYPVQTATSKKLAISVP